MTPVSPLLQILDAIEDPADGRPLAAPAMRWGVGRGDRGATVQGTTGFTFSADWAGQVRVRAVAALAARGEARESFGLRPRHAAQAVQGRLWPHSRTRIGILDGYA